MPWDNDEGSDKGAKKPGSPWENNNRGNNNYNQDFDEMMRKSKNRLKKFFNLPEGDNNIFLYAVGIAIVLWLATGIYTIEEGEQALVLRFGKLARIATPGPNYHLPEPIETIIREKTGRVEKVEIGFRSKGGSNDMYGQRNTQNNIPEESLMLTGDENIVDINFVVQWKIRDIKDYVFEVNKVKETVKSAAESAMREVIGNTPIIAAQTEGQSSVEHSAKLLLQSTLDSYNSGIEITNLKLLKVYPPVEVIDAFRDVQTAKADKEREINQAQAYQNDIIPRARGEASRIIQEAEAYKQEVVSLAQGEVSRFNAVYNQYKNAKNVTRKRMYLETVENVLQGMDKIIIDPTIEKSVLPYLPLPQLNNKTK